MLPAFDLISWVGRVISAPPPVPPGGVAHGHANGRAGHAADGHIGGAADPSSLARRAAAYLDRMPPAVSGQGGHDRAFDAACVLVKGFDLGVTDARPILAAWAARCVPPWSDKEVDHKLASADEKPDDKPRGYLADAPAGGREGQGGRANGRAHANGHAAANGREGPPPVDRAALTAQAEAFLETAANRLEVLYLAREFHADLARLERADPPAAEAIKAVLRRIPRFLQRPFDKAMATARAALDAERIAHAPPVDPDAVSHDFSDLGNGRRLVDLHGHRIRHCKAYGDWLIYDGRRWTRDEMYAIEAMAQEVPRQILAEIPATPDPETLEGYKKWSLSSQSRDRLDAMTRTARSMLAVTPDHLDQDPWLLNVQNGTIELRTGTFREHRAADLITRMADVAHDETATAPRWEEFVLEIMGSNRELADYLQRAVGYAITGVIREHVLFFLYGTGRNGKTVFLNTLFSTLADYSNEIDSDLLISQNFAQHPTGLTELEGRRLVAADEADEGRRLAEAQVKKLTGGNPIQARRMQKDFYTFQPSHHLFFAANHKPEIRGMDVGIWRRVKLIPFEVAFDLEVKGGKEPDLELEEKLIKERPGILNWMLKGCREWQEKGLQEPGVIRQLGRDYQSEMDVLGWFVEERCAVDETAGARVVLSVLYGEYTSWCETNNVAPLSIRKFSGQMGDRSFKTFKSNSIVFKTGIRLKTGEERYAATQDAHADRGADGASGENGAGGEGRANGRDVGVSGDMGRGDYDWTKDR